MKKLTYTACSLLALSISLNASSAQAGYIDYGSLQELFGEAITTNVIGTPQKMGEVPANMTIITADEIKKSGSRNIPEILSRVPGIDVLRTGIQGFDVGVRGFQQPFQPRLLVLLDGRQVFIDDFSRTDWNNIPVNIDDIRQIEVVKGPASALFGSNAAGGVVNIITYNPLYDNNNVASATLGTQKVHQGDGTVTFNGEWGGTKFSAGGFESHAFDKGWTSADTTPIQPYHNFVSNSTIFNISPSLKISTEATFSESEENFAGPTYSQWHEKMATYSLRGGFQWQTDFGTITSNNYVNNNRATITWPYDNDPYTLTTNLIVSQLEDQFKIGSDHTFRAAIEYRNKSFKTRAVQVRPQASNLVENNYAASIMWNWTVNNKVSWTNAARFDHQDMHQAGTLMADSYFTDSDYSHSDNNFSLNSGLVYKATDKDTFRLTYGRGVQMPSLMENGLNQNIPSGANVFDIEGNPDVKPTIAQNYELGYDRKVPEIFSVAKFSVYYELNQTARAPKIGSPRMLGGTPYIIYADKNVGNSEGYGGELQIKGSHNGFRWDASYSYARVIDTKEASASLGFDGSSPRHRFRLSGGYTMGSWNFDTAAQMVSETRMLRSIGMTNTKIKEGGYTTLSARIGYDINDMFDIALYGNNINHDYLTTGAFPKTERQLFLTLTGKF